MITNLINARLVVRFGTARLLRWGTMGAALSAVVVAVDARTGWGGLAGLVLPLFLFFSMTGFIVANSIAGALADYPEQAGAVSALVGAIHYGTGIVRSALVGAFANGTPWPLGWVIALSGLGAARPPRFRHQSSVIWISEMGSPARRRASPCLPF
jgi:DHA1 family bicyclomycin/chloramphenicol resistance-like MFS transporter